MRKLRNKLTMQIKRLSWKPAANSQLQIKQKVVIMPVLVMFIFFIIVLAILTTNNRNKSLFVKIQSQYYPLLELAQQVEQEFSLIQEGLQDAVAMEDSTYLERVDSLQVRLNKQLLEGKQGFGAEYSGFLRAQFKFYEYYPIARHTSLRMISEQNTENLVADLQLMTSKYNQIKNDLESNTDRIKIKIDRAFKVVDRNRRASVKITFFVILTGLLLLIWVSYIIIRSINRPLKEVVGVASKVSAGNLQVHIELDRNDEFGLLKETFSKMLQKINQLIAEKDDAYNHLFIAKEIKEKDARKLAKLNEELTGEIKERKKIARELSIHRDHLEELVEDRTAELQKSNLQLQNEIEIRKAAEDKKEKLLQEIESVNSELKEFAYVVSHDLKAPLRAINSLADWLLMDHQEKLGEDGKELLTLMISRVKRMHSLIEGILQYSRVGRIREEKVVVNLSQSVPSIIDFLSPPENISIEIETDLPVISFERTRIDQLFQNLLSNGIKYMDKPQGLIRIGCSEDKDQWKFWVSDNGPGIEEKYFEKVFKIFQTLKARDEFESTGVGLSLVKKIIDMYGGKVWIESIVGEGTTFFFTIPKISGETEQSDAILSPAQVAEAI